MNLLYVINRYGVPAVEWMIVAFALHRNFNGKNKPAAGMLLFGLTAGLMFLAGAIPLQCPFLKPALIITGLTIAICLIYEAPLYVAAFFCVAVMYIDTISDLVMGNLFVSLAPGDLEIILRDDTWERLLLGVASKGLQGIITLILVVGFGTISWHVPRIYWGMLDAILALYFVLVLSASTFNPRPNMIFDSRLIALMAGIFLATNLLPVVLFARMSNHYIQSQLEYTSRMTKCMIDNGIQMFEKERADVQNTRHGFKDTISTINMLIRDKQDEDALRYIAKYMSSLPPAQIAHFTGVSSIDSVITMKRAVAKAHGIAITIDAQEMPAKTAPILDICSILSNLLDNAIEASRELPVSERRIQLDLCVQGKIFSVAISNTYRNEPLRVNDRFITSKPDIDSHGLGLVIVRELCDRHDGQFHIEYLDGTFTARVLLTLPPPGS